MEIKGIVHKVDAPQTREYNGKEYTSQKIYLDTTDYSKEKVWENYPSFEFSGKTCDELMTINSGDTVTIQFDINGRFYQKNGEERHFNTVRAWKIEVNERTGQTIEDMHEYSMYNPTLTIEEPKHSEVAEIDSFPF